MRYSTTGRYLRLTTNGINNVLNGLPMQPSSTSRVFWEAILPLVTADITSPH